MAEPEDLVAAYVDLVEAEWVRGGLPARERRRLCADLERDLTAALAAGAPAAEVFGVDAVTLARDVAEAAGLGLSPPSRPIATRSGLVVRGLAGAAAMITFVWFVALPTLADVADAFESSVARAMSVLALYAVCLVLVLGGAAGSMALYLRPMAGWRSVVARATAAMGVLGAAGAVLCAAIGARADDDSTPWLLARYVLIVGGLAACGIAVGWRHRVGEETVAFEQVFE